MAVNIDIQAKSELVDKKKIKGLRKLKLSAYEQFDIARSQASGHANSVNALNTARELICQVINVNPADGDSLNLLSRIELERGENALAQQAIESALQIEPENGGFWYSSGHAALAMQEFEKARYAFESAIEFAPKETNAELSLAYTLSLSGQTVQAFHKYRELIKTHNHDQTIRSQLLQSAEQLRADHYDAELEQDLITYLKWKNVNLNQLAGLTCSLLEHKYQLNNDGSASNFEDIAQCPLILIALRKTLLKSHMLEKLIMALRQELLSHSTQKGKLNNQHVALSDAIAQYGIRSEYILPATEAEQDMINTLKAILDDSLDKPGCTPTDISGALMLLSMYEPWSTLKNYQALMVFDQDNWPSLTFDLWLSNRDLNQLNEQQFKSLTAIPSIEDHDVKSQYESFPYPRWENLDHKRPTNYGSALSHEYPDTNFNSYLFDSQLNILIAGCGTGRHALNVAKHFTNTSITAVDISQKSLAYASKKSLELDIKNISFSLVDLTKLPSLEKKYDIVECSGVLHHIPNYEVALNNLLSNLKPNGLLKISLYSQYSRESINQVRSLFNKEDNALTDHKVKIIRQALLQGELIDNNSGIINSDDFYSMSGTIDLLFHEYERQFTPLDLKELCETNQLEWLGFCNLDYKTKQGFLDFHGPKANLKDLFQWDIFEQKHPETFSKMYQFYCQYKPKLKVQH